MIGLGLLVIVLFYSSYLGKRYYCAVREFPLIDWDEEISQSKHL